MSLANVCGEHPLGHRSYLTRCGPSRGCGTCATAPNKPIFNPLCGLFAFISSPIRPSAAFQRFVPTWRILRSMQPAASPQRVALSALRFLYRDVLHRDLPYIDHIAVPHVRRGCRWSGRATRHARVLRSSMACRGWSPVCCTAAACA